MTSKYLAGFLLLLWVIGFPISSSGQDKDPTQEDADRVTFNEHIASIVFDNCSGCHRPGEAAPFPLLNYRDVTKRGRLIASVTRTRYMPPWHAGPGWGDFRDERRLTDVQVGLIDRWVSQGMPEGDSGAQPVPPRFPQGWQLGQPDLVIRLEEAFLIPEDGPDLYRNFVMKLDLETDKWVRAVAFRPQARTSAHHALFCYDTTGEARRLQEEDPRPGYENMVGAGSVGRRQGGLRSSSGRPGFGGLGGWAVGGTPHLLPEGLGRLLPANAEFVVQMHFHPSGKEETEQGSIGVYYSRRKPERTLTALQLPPLFGALAGIDIPAGEKSYSIQDSFTLPIDVEVFGASAHAHYLGREFKLWAVLPGQNERKLLWIPDWDFSWQEQYFYRNPVRLPEGTRIQVSLSYDNSAQNPNNPNHPPRRVSWGRASTDEMGSMSLILAPLRNEDLPRFQSALREQRRSAFVERILDNGGPATGPLLRGLLNRFDQDGDGSLSEEEKSQARAFLLRRAGPAAAGSNEANGN